MISYRRPAATGRFCFVLFCFTGFLPSFTGTRRWNVSVMRLAALHLVSLQFFCYPQDLVGTFLDFYDSTALLTT